jgi:hypothetical protein
MRQETPSHIGRGLSTSFVLIILSLSLFSCSSNDAVPTEKCKGTAEQYGVLANAVRLLAKAKDDVFEQNERPRELTANEFIELANQGGYLPPKYYEELKLFRLIIKIDGKDYVFKVYNPDNGCLIVYDCSCSETKLDGLVYEDPLRYNEDNLPCECD